MAMGLLGDRFPWVNNITEIESAILITILIAIGVTLLLVATLHDESFSSVYLNSTSYSPYYGDGEISFVYGIQSSEREAMDYRIAFFINDVPAGNNEVRLRPGEKFEEMKILRETNITLPAQVRVEVTTPEDFYEVHYWLQKPK